MKLNMLVAALFLTFNAPAFAQVLIGDVIETSQLSLEQLQDIERHYLVRLNAIADRALIASKENEPVLYQIDAKQTSASIIQLNPIQKQIESLGGTPLIIPAMPILMTFKPQVEPAADDLAAWTSRWVHRYETILKRAAIAIEVLDRDLYDSDLRAAGIAYEKILELNKAVVAAGGTAVSVKHFPGFFKKEETKSAE